MPRFNLQRVVDDAIELAEYARRKLGKKKIVLVGQSAGTALGLKVAQARPDLFYAFVGTAQMVSVRRSAEWQEKQTDIPRTHDGAEMKALHQWAIEAPADQPREHPPHQRQRPPDLPCGRHVPRLSRLRTRHHGAGQRPGRPDRRQGGSRDREPRQVAVPRQYEP